MIHGYIDITRSINHSKAQSKDNGIILRSDTNGIILRVMLPISEDQSH